MEHRTSRDRDQEIIDGLKVTCKCREGLTTIEELKRATGAGTGTCKGKECTQKIAELLKEAKNK
jgi:bacterioferritin-associated ferredoxin